MHKTKALIRYEMRYLSWVFLYFLGAFLFIGWSLSNQMTYTYKFLFEQVLPTDLDLKNYFMNSFIEGSFILVFFGILGIMLLVYLQHKATKHLDTGRFLKVLPISSTAYFKIRAITGVLTFTIPYLLLSIWVLVIYSSTTEWSMDLFALSSYSEHLVAMNSMGRVIGELTLIYLLLVMTYFFLVVFQYLVTQPIASLIIASLVSLTPAYLFMVAELDINWPLGYISVGSLFPWYLPADRAHVGFGYDPSAPFYSYITYIDYLGLKLFIILACAVLLAVAGFFLAKGFRIEKAEQFIPAKWARITFIAGVTICATFLPKVFIEMFTLWRSNVGLMLCMFMAAIIGFLISKKIASIGIKGGSN